MNFEVTNLSSEFSEFLLKSEVESADSSWQLWLDLIGNRLPDFYETLVVRTSAGEDVQQRYKSLFLDALPMFKKHQALIAMEFADFENKLLAGIDSFSKILPEFKSINMHVYAVPSLVRFNGFSAEYKGQKILAFGVDMIAISMVDPAIVPKMIFKSNPSVLYAHEIFHVYHDKKRSIDIDREKILLHRVWDEGLATYASGLVNPDAELADLFMDRNLGDISRSERLDLLKMIASDFDHNLVDGDGAAALRDWFLLSSKRSDIPVRAGYVAGYELVRSLAEIYSIEDMVSWSNQEAVDCIKKSWSVCVLA